MKPRIRSLELHGAEPQCRVGIDVAPEGDLRVDVDTVDAYGEVQGDTSIVGSGRPNSRSATNVAAGPHGRRRQIGV